MSVFAYNPGGVSAWSKKIVGYLNGAADSVESVSKKFKEQLDILVEPNVWTGPAAYANYHNFLDTHRAMINFINAFGGAFEESMISLNKAVQDLETANLGNASNMGSFDVAYTNLNTVAETNINQAKVVYDYAKIQQISATLSSIMNTLEQVHNNLNSEIEKLDAQADVWDGTAAAAGRDTLKEVLEKNMKVVKEDLKKCISNIKTAAEAAQAADRA